MIIAIGNDHAGCTHKDALMESLQSEGHSVIDCGAYTTDEVDYPDIVRVVVDTYNDESQDVDLCILICGTGIGMSIAANKYRGIRAAVINDTFSAEMAKAHNHANCICLGARILSVEDMLSRVQTFLSTVEMGGKHDRRIHKVIETESN